MDVAAFKRDQLCALMIAELDARLHGRGEVLPLELPDESERIHEAVELRAQDDELEMVIEHTRVESYPNQAKDKIVALDMFPGRFGPEIPDCWEAGYMRVSIEAGRLARVPKTSRPRVAEALTEWVRENIDRVHAPHQPGGTMLVRGSHPDVPFGWSLSQVISFETASLYGALARVAQIGFYPPPDAAQLRAARMETALAKKLRKLSRSAGAHRRSILALEERDSFLSSPVDVSLALQAASAGRELPDAVYLFDTCHGDPHALLLHENGTWAHEGENRFNWHYFPVERSSQFNVLPVSWA